MRTENIVFETLEHCDVLGLRKVEMVEWQGRLYRVERCPLVAHETPAVGWVFIDGGQQAWVHETFSGGLCIKWVTTLPTIPSGKSNNFEMHTARLTPVL